MKALAEKEAEAIGIRLKMSAEAEGFQKQVDAMNSADENFMAIKLIEKLPEIYKHISPEHMIVMGEGNEGFNSILQSILPLMEILPAFTSRIQNAIPTSKKTKKKQSKSHAMAPSENGADPDQSSS